MATVAVFMVLGGGAFALTNREKQKIRTIARNQASKLDKEIELLPGPKGDTGEPGEQGPKGDKGDAATSLFAYIRDPGNTGEDAVVQYGSGVTDVSEVDDAPLHYYRVTFDQSIENCVVHATSGNGVPTGSVLTRFSFASVDMALGTANQAEVTFRQPNSSGGLTQVETSFVISAFC
jgi:hypothetical protein